MRQTQWMSSVQKHSFNSGFCDTSVHSLRFRPTGLLLFIVACGLLFASAAHASGAAVVKLTATPMSRQAAANTPVEVRCDGFLADGSSSPVPNAYITLQDALAEVDLHHFSSRKAGVFGVRCHLPQSAHQPAVNSEVALVHIVAGVPSALRVRLYRQGKCFTQGARLPLVWRVVDSFDNDIEDADVSMKTFPPTPVRRDVTGGFIVDDEISIEATLTAHCVGCEVLTPKTLSLRIDSTAPTMVIHHPSRGEMVEDALVERMIEGEVRDGLGPIESIHLLGVSQPVAANVTRQDFAMPITPRWGLNILEGTVEDACGNVGIVRQSFLASPEYAPLATEPSEAARAEHAVEVAFSQALWDDEDRSTSHDVSTLIQMALDNTDLGERLPEHLVAWPDPTGTAILPEVHYRCGPISRQHKASGIQIQTDGKVTYKEPVIEYVRAIEGGWHVSFSLHDVRVPVVYNSYGDLGCLGSTKNAYHAVLVAETIRVEATPQVVMERGEPRVQLCPSCVHIDFGNEFARPHIGAAKWGVVPVPAAVLRVIDWWAATSIGRLHEPLEAKVRQELTGELETFLRGLRLEHSLPLPQHLRAEVLVSSGVDEVKLHGEEGSGGGTFSLYGQFYTPKLRTDVPHDVPMAPRTPKGAIRHARTARPTLTLAPKSAFALAVQDDLLNQMLHSIWASGALSHENVRQMLLPKSKASSSKKQGQSNLLDAAKLRIYFSTPPVLMPGAHPGTVQLGLGDVYAEADLDTYRLFGVDPPEEMPHLTAGFFFSALLNAQLELDPASQHLKVTPLESPRILLQAVKNPTPPMEQSVNYWLEKQLNRSVPQMLAHMLGAFPLPELQVGRITGVPDNLVWVLDGAQLKREAHAHAFELQGALKEARLNPVPAEEPEEMQ